LPTGEEVLEGHVEAIGGRKAIERFQTLYIKSEIELPSRKIEGTSEMWWQRKVDKLGNFAVAQVLDGVGTNAAGFDGEELWVRDDYNGLRTLEGREAELYQRGSSPFLIADWRRHFRSAETRERVETPQGSQLQVELITPLEQRVVMLFDETSGLLSELRYDELGPQGPRPLVSKSLDYRRVEGVRFAHEQRTQSAYGEMIQRTISVEANPKVDAERFGSPLGGERVDVDPSKQKPAPLRAD
jgi:hypothetical protein